MDQLLQATIRTLCPLIEDRVQQSRSRTLSEFDLRRELVTCVLGSQVRHETAANATRNLVEAGLLEDQWWADTDAIGFADKTFEVLDGRRTPERSGRYRFAKTRAYQLEGARVALAQSPLRVRLSAINDPIALRNQLVADIPGIGPKQASMFLRNIGRSYDLAILDTHVMRFIHSHGLCSLEDLRIGTSREYAKVERILVGYAESIGYRAGYLDWAIWATMKAAGELGL